MFEESLFKIHRRTFEPGLDQRQVGGSTVRAQLLGTSMELAPNLISGFVRDVSAYFRDFLATDFRKQNAPKRAIQLKDGQGLLTAINLRKYPTFFEALRRPLSDPLHENSELNLRIPRNRFRSKVSGLTASLVRAHVDSLSDSELQKVGSAFIAKLTKIASSSDAQKALDDATQALKAQLISYVVVPLVQRLEGTFDRDGKDGFETIFQIEEELGSLLIDGWEEALENAFATYVTRGESKELEEAVQSVCDKKAIHTRVSEYCATLGTSDLFEELHQLQTKCRLNDNVELYLYLGVIGFKAGNYPIFFVPAKLVAEPEGFNVVIDRTLYVNKHALEFVAQEYGKEISRPIGLLVKDRILYLGDHQAFLSTVQSLLDQWTPSYAVPNSVNLALLNSERSANSSVTVTNAFYLATHDKADEAVLNDYEDLMNLLDSDSSEAAGFFKTIQDFLFSNPTSVDHDISIEWDEKPTSERLVFESPVALNEEQLKVLSALKHSATRFVVIEGPPGTGKSHTITAIAFDALMNGKNILVLSDKTEALDVVENKLTETLNATRPSDGFQNPILRLGRVGSTYSQILSTQSVNAVKSQLSVNAVRMPEIERTSRQHLSALKSQIDQLVKVAGEIEHTEIAELHALEKVIEDTSPHCLEALKAASAHLFLQQLSIIAKCVSDVPREGIEALLSRSFRSGASFAPLGVLASTQQALHRARISDTERACISLFDDFEHADFANLTTIIRNYETLKNPVFGFVFSRSKARAIDGRISNDGSLSLRNVLEPHRELKKLRVAFSTFSKLSKELSKDNVQERIHRVAFCQAIQGVAPFTTVSESIASSYLEVKRLIEADAKLKVLLDELPNSVFEWAEPSVASSIETLRRFAELWSRLSEQFSSLPDVDYVSTLSQIHKSSGKKLAHRLDEKLVWFANERRNDAKTLKEVIRKKQRFPRDKFAALKEAFPIIIASIRDYSEYIPLESGLFDVVIIDEASQVSIAQAFPAFVRAKQLVVLGDSKQYSNVKTATASTEINQTYLTQIMGQLGSLTESDASLAARVKKFNIKTSVLDFASPIANCSVALKKHFRSYPELISFSSKYFYNDGLQAVKIRGIPLPKVIQFTQLADVPRSPRKNTNAAEADAIFDELGALADGDVLPTVGIITPFTEQQRYLLGRVQKQAGGEELIHRLKLKIMTFDSCQGEERDIIFYSFVATENLDRLNYIFPRNLNSDDVEENLRKQRLNVGFSRAKERVHFFLSKPLENIDGALGVALRHYKWVLDEGARMPTSSDVDPSSPMEQKLLHWLTRTKFFNDLRSSIEVDAQFKIGEYLRQLDRSYRHPKYRVDFLLKVNTDVGVDKIVLEYDGFKEHFDELSDVNEFNYESYMKAADVERQKVLESYGYKFVRMNRFNCGKDPVRSLDERLWRIVNGNGLHAAGLDGRSTKETAQSK